MQQARAPIGVLDSGVGGLSVLKHLRLLMPGEDFLYLGDTARNPYGSRSREELHSFVEEILTFMHKAGVKFVVVACNTISAMGVEDFVGKYPFSIVKMSKGEDLVAARPEIKRLGILATEFTIGTGAHKRAFAAKLPAVEVFGQACPLLVPLVEQECFGTPELLAAAKLYVEPLKEQHVDALLLACTHYPFAEKELAQAAGPEIRLLDPAEQTAAEARKLLAAENLLQEQDKGKTTVCFTADLERNLRLAAKMLSTNECAFKIVKL